MKLTRASSYALHAIAYMAQQKVQNAPVASHHIAAERGIPERFLLKVLKPLVSRRILLSVKGPNGGYRLARAASDITMLEIVEAVDGELRGYAPERPTDKDEEHTPSEIKKYKQVWNTLHPKLERVCGQTAEQIRKSLERVKVSDLLNHSK
ncbi:MAG TPA: Rrf2 family transcriptional regulator [Gemmataceae bacterium]|jgi:Rrf2 family protein